MCYNLAMSVFLLDLIEMAREILPIDVFPEQKEEIFRIVHKVFGLERHEIYGHKDIINPFQKREWEKILKDRASGRPLAYVLGYTYFYKDCFPVSEETLIPRYDTEHLVESVYKHYEGKTALRILDVGTGTGVIAISLFRMLLGSKITALDLRISPIKKSLESLGLTNESIDVKEMDFLDESLWPRLGEMDCVVSNPPYLDDVDMSALDKSVYDFEPHSALYGGVDGMIFYQKICDFCFNFLIRDGLIALEVDHKYPKVMDLFSEKGFIQEDLIFDYADLPRVLLFTKPF